MSLTTESVSIYLWLEIILSVCLVMVNVQPLCLHGLTLTQMSTFHISHLHPNGTRYIIEICTRRIIKILNF